MRKLTLTAVAAVGLLLGAAPAQAISLTATPANSLASGTFHIRFEPNGGTTSYLVIIEGNPDGRVTADSTGPAKHSLSRVTVGILRPDLTYATSNGASGWLLSSQPVVFWSTTVFSDVVQFNSPAAMSNAAPFGGNQFVGVVGFLNDVAAPGVTVLLEGGGQQWFATGTLAPEPGSLALALPGLLPIGLMLLRRRSRHPEDGEPVSSDD